MGRDEAVALFDESRRAFDLACRAQRRSGPAAAAPLLRRSLHVLAALIAALGDERGRSYDDDARAAERVAARERIFDGPVLDRLLRVDALGSRATAGLALGDDDLDDLLPWAADVLHGVRRYLGLAFAPSWRLAESGALLAPVAAFFVTRVVLELVAYVGLRVQPPSETQWVAFPHDAWLDGWVRWDAGWYRSVVLRGYDAYAPSGPASNVAFFPLYPWVSQLLSIPATVVTDSERAYYGAALVLSLASFAAALIGMVEIGRRRVGHAAAARSVWLLALFPFSFVFAAPYPEAFFLALAVWSFVLFERGSLVGAAALASAAAVTRPAGFVLAAVMAVVALRAASSAPSVVERRRAAVAVVAALCGPTLLLVFFRVRFGDPLVFFHAFETGWSSRPGVDHVLSLFRRLASDPPLSSALPATWALASALGAALLARATWRTLGPAYAVFALVPLASALVVTVEGFSRFVAVAFPLFLVAGATLRRRAALRFVGVVFAPLLAFFTYTFTHWGATGGP